MGYNREYGQQERNAHEARQQALMGHDHAYSQTSVKDARIAELEKALRWALGWIDAVPRSVQLPAMPGFDRDHVNGLLARTALKEKTPTP